MTLVAAGIVDVPILVAQISSRVTQSSINKAKQVCYRKFITLGIRASKRISNCGTGPEEDLLSESDAPVEGAQEIKVFSNPRMNVCNHNIVNPSKLTWSGLSWTKHLVINQN